MKNIPPWVAEFCKQLHVSPSSSKPIKLTPISGGDINTCFCLKYQTRRFFVKTNIHTAAQSMFESEKYALEQLRRCDDLRIPKPITQGIASGVSFLGLEYVELKNRGDWLNMGKSLAKLHSFKNNQFGWVSSNFIGTTPQLNQPHDGWSDFWWRNRLQPQIDLTEQNGFTSLVSKKERFFNLNKIILQDHQPSPSLLHGDLWAGNAAFDEQGTPCFYDPASYYGDRETDLALTELFGGYPAEFYQGYTSILPLPDQYQLRKTWYNLYHLLNHANLFGGHYENTCLSTLETLERQLINR